MLKALKRFFMLCSGATIQVLDRPECFTEQNKYASVGATVFFTAVLAALSSGYAMFTVFNSPTRAVVFGVFWGLMIFNLDRYIVSSLGVEDPETITGSGQRFKAFLNTATMAAPRLFLAIVLSLVITKPLEMKFYEDDIRTQLSKERSERIATRQPEIESEFPYLKPNKDRLKDLKDGIAKKEEEINKEREAVIREVAGGSGEGFSGRQGEGANYERRQLKLNAMAAELDGLRQSSQPEMARLEELIKIQEEAKERRRAEVEEEEGLRTGLAAKVAAIHNLGMADKTYLVISLFVTLLFIMLETAPIFVKLLSKYGPYDLILDQEEEAAIALVREKTKLKLEIQEILNSQLKYKMTNSDSDQMRAYTAEIMRDLYSDWRHEKRAERERYYRAKSAGQG